MLLHEVQFSRLCLLVGAVLLLFPPVVTREAFIQAGETTVQGQVEDLQGQPKQFVSISLKGPERYVAITNAEGVFVIKNVTPGTYTVRVRQGDLVAEFTRDVGGDKIDLVLVVDW